MSETSWEQFLWSHVWFKREDLLAGEPASDSFSYFSQEDKDMKIHVLNESLRNSNSTSCRCASWLLVLMLGVTTAPARNQIRQAFFQNYPSAVGSVLDTVPSKPGHCGV